jgi:hypothetical protein
MQKRIFGYLTLIMFANWMAGMAAMVPLDGWPYALAVAYAGGNAYMCGGCLSEWRHSP